MVWLSDHPKVEFCCRPPTNTNDWVQYMSIHNNTHQGTTIQLHTYHYIQIQTNTIPNKFFHMVSIGLYRVCSIQTNTHQIHTNTYKYIPILNTNGDETRRVSGYGLASIWYVFGMYLVCIRMYLFVFACIGPRLTLRVLPPYVFRIGMYLACTYMYWFVYYKLDTDKYKPL